MPRPSFNRQFAHLRRAPDFTSSSRYSIAGSERLRLAASTKSLASGAGLPAGTANGQVFNRWYCSAPDYVTNNWRFAFQTFSAANNAETAMTAGKTVIVQSVLLRYSTDLGVTWSGFYECDGAAEAGCGSFDSTTASWLAPRIQVSGGVPANALIEGRMVMKQPFGLTMPNNTLTVALNDYVSAGLSNMLAEASYALSDSNADGSAGAMWAKRTTTSSVPTGASSGSSGGAYLPPFLAFATGGDGRATALVIGDSGQGHGTSDSSVVTLWGVKKDGTANGRLTTSFINRGFDDNTDTKRIASGNMGVAGSDPVQLAKDINAGTSLKVQALTEIKTALGHCGFDVLFNGHFANSRTNTYDDGSAAGSMNATTPGTYNALGYINTQFNTRFGCKVIQNTSILAPTSTDAFATLANQSTASDSTYPSGTAFAAVAQGNASYTGLPNSWKWLFDLTKFGSIVGSAPDTTARIRTDFPTVVIDVCEPWRLDAYDLTTANVDNISILTGSGEPGYSNGETVSGTVAVAYASGTSIPLSFKPRIGASLVWKDDGNTTRGIYVHSVASAGGGNWTVTWKVASSSPTATSAGVVVRESHAAADGLHRSPAIHAYRYPEAVLKVKRRLSAYGMS